MKMYSCDLWLMTHSKGPVLMEQTELSEGRGWKMKGLAKKHIYITHKHRQ